MASLSKKNIDNYGYSLYNEYVDRFAENALKYANRRGLSIRYYKINMEESSGEYEEEIALQLSYKKFVYDIYNFVPVVDMSPPTTQIYYDQNERGTSYVTTFTMTITNIKNPLPGDLFHFYDTKSTRNVDATEVFRIKRVLYNRSMNKNHGIYQVEVESAPYSISSLDNFTIKNQYYYNHEIQEYYTSDDFQFAKYISDHKDLFKKEILSKLDYNYEHSTYGYSKLDFLIKYLGQFGCSSNYIKLEEYYNLAEFMYIFDRYYFDLNLHPITNEKLYEVIDVVDDPNTVEIESGQTLEFNDIEKNKNQFNSLEYSGTIEDSSDDINLLQFTKDSLDEFLNTGYYFDDILSKNIKNNLYNRISDKENTEEITIRIIEKIVEKVPDPNSPDPDNPVMIDAIRYEKHQELFDVYDYIYKCLFSLREINPKFYTALDEYIKTEKNNGISEIDKYLYYSIFGEESNGYSNPEVTRTKNYEDFYYITYNGGLVQGSTTLMDPF